VKTVTLTAAGGSSSATVVPERGGLVTGFIVDGEPLLFLDRETLEDPTKNVRGGVPVLFPFPGRPPPGIALKQHGFARLEAWELTEVTQTQLVCRLASAHPGFPYPYQLTLTVTVTPGALTLAFELENRAHVPMPLHFGLHPYFAVTDKQAAWVETNATRAFNQRAGTTGPLPPLRFGGDELDVHLLDHRGGKTVLHRGSAPPISLEWSENFQTLVLWTLPGKPFICVEPWTAPAGTSGQNMLRPGGRELLGFSIRVGR